MKKFMKAIAFVTVMCMALSTVAFAETGAVLDETTEKVLNITVEGAGTDQVALVVVDADAEENDFSDPLYIDQQAAVSGTATFRAVLTNADADAVDIYVGYSSWGGNAARKIGENVAITEPVTAITVTKAPDQDVILDAEFAGTLKGDDQTGAGVAATFEVVSPEGAIATNMIWAIRYIDKDGKPQVGYTESIGISGYGFGSVSCGSVKLGIAFLNGSDLREINPVDITAVDAIFLFEGGKEVFTNEAADEGNKLTNNSGGN